MRGGSVPGAGGLISMAVQIIDLEAARLRRARSKARRVSDACGGCGTATPTDLCDRCVALLEAFCTQEVCI